MKIAVIGATGMIGQRIVREALSRGHQVTAVARKPKPEAELGGAAFVAADSTDAESIAAAVRGHDAVVSATSPAPDTAEAAAAKLIEGARGLAEGLRKERVKRLLVVGGAGSLEVAPGVQLFDTPAFPEAWQWVGRAHGRLLDAIRGPEFADLEWTYVSPPALIQPGERTGRFRTGTDRLLVDEGGSSHISAEDYAVALVDEIEEPMHVRGRITAGY
jgi:putative NADH-flavin reductase